MDDIGDYLFFKNQRMEASNLKLIRISSTWDCTTFHNFLSMFKKKIIILQKLAGLWLADKVVNHVGIYGSKAAEGLSAFQRRSCWLCKWWLSIIIRLCYVVQNSYPQDEQQVGIFIGGGMLIKIILGGMLIRQSRVGGPLDELGACIFCSTEVAWIILFSSLIFFVAISSVKSVFINVKVSLVCVSIDFMLKTGVLQKFHASSWLLAELKIICFYFPEDQRYILSVDTCWSADLCFHFLFCMLIEPIFFSFQIITDAKFGARPEAGRIWQ